MICLRRTQDLEGIDDEFCIRCFCDTDFGDNSYVPKRYFLSRDDCQEENCVSVEEFDQLFGEVQRCGKSTNG